MPHKPNLTEGLPQRVAASAVFRRNITLSFKMFKHETDSLKISLFSVSTMDGKPPFSDKLNQMGLLQSCEAAR